MSFCIYQLIQHLILAKTLIVELISLVSSSNENKLIIVELISLVC